MILKGSNNLCSIYLLPLVGCNSNSFGIGNFVNSYLSETNEYLVVKLKQINSVIKLNPNYKFNYSQDNAVSVVYEIPKQHQEAVQLFREGKYSKFPEESKQIIRINSKLIYKFKLPNGLHKSAPELLVLDKDPTLRQLLEKELECKLPKDAELASIPGEDNFTVLTLSDQLVC